MSFYNADNMDQKTMFERCREYYNPEDFVVVMNVDVEPFTYVQQRPENVKIHQPSQVTKEVYYTKDPDVITINPGQTRMVPAYEADNFIKLLTDKMVLRGRAKYIAETGENPKESTSDPATQHKYIKMIYQGKKDFMAEYNQQTQQIESVNSELKSELESELDSEPVTSETPRGPGRPKKQVA